MKKVILSPHPDDAALSLGASIFYWASGGEEPLVVNSTGGSSRMKEDEKAMVLLGAKTLSLGIPDAIYRGYEGNAIFKEPKVDDSSKRAVFAGLMGALDTSVEDVYVPMALGNHVDHVITREAAKAVARAESFSHVRFWLYEDYPYAKHCLKEEPEDDDWVKGGTSAHVLHHSAKAIELKVRAIAQYGSQMAPLFRSPTLMGDEVTRYFKEHGERVWRVK